MIEGLGRIKKGGEEMGLRKKGEETVHEERN
jgi:hypothetical protein